MGSRAELDERGETTNREALFTILRIMYRFERAAMAQIGQLQSDLSATRAEVEALKRAANAAGPR